MTNSKQTKKALYSSVVSLLLCFVMLIGTTFAWFTDNASTNVNKIQAGNLDVALEMKDANGKWVSAEGKTLDFVKAAAAEENEAILWEPGCTYSLPELRIVNNGNLALKYKVLITGIKGDAKLNEAIDWTIGYVAEGEDQRLAVGANNEFTISGTMKTTAGNEYQGLSIDGIAITVYAKQDTVEFDSTTNEYDKDAEYDIPWDGTSEGTVPEADQDGKIHISTVEEFVALMNNTQNVNSAYINKTIVLDCDINFGGNTIKGIGSDISNFAGTFDGNSHTISNFVIDATNRDYYAGLFNYVAFGGSVQNLTVKNATVRGKAMVGAVVGGLDDNSNVSNCKVYNSTLIGDKKVGAVVGYAAGQGSVTDNYAENCAVYYSIKEGSAILGYQNNGVTVSNNSYKNVKVENASVTTIKTSDATELTNALKNNSNIINVTLTGNVEIAVDSGTQWANAFGGNDTKIITIDGQGKYTLTFNQTDSDWNHVVTNGAELVLKNLKLTNSGYNNGPWNQHDIVFDCKVTLENVTSDKAIALGANASMTNVTINESEDVYALWITADGQSVTLNNVNINSSGRAIAIKDQYRETTSKKVTLNMDTCKFNSAKKAAVLVTSTAGAVINANNVDISEVKADSTNLIWVDKGDLKDVTVTGATAVVEP